MKRPAKGAKGAKGGKGRKPQDAAEESAPREFRAGTQAGYQPPTRKSHRKGMPKRIVAADAAWAATKAAREAALPLQPVAPVPAPAPAVQPAPKPVVRPAAKPTGKPAVRRAAKPVDKPVGKSVGKSRPQAPAKAAPAKPFTPRPRPAPVELTIPEGPDSGLIVRLSRVLNVPASAIFRAINDPERRGWAPESLFRIMSVLAPRFIRLAFPDGTNVAISVARQGNARALVALEITKLPIGTDERDVKERWDEALSALQEQLDTSWD
ncbi:hypothetical protein [Gemmatimonas sp.]|uniref:hypothetical protein n=1 Tax=Gemmatimonas sp. TaxID=1962908 RepID=UPI003F6E4E0B